MNGKTSDNDYKYMYEFRTRRCNQKGCIKYRTCFDAHSKKMSRRIPKQLSSGQFNYIPLYCQQYRKSKKCDLGDSCYRSHGWLEVIFHPLLYKTKSCSHKKTDGVCERYGAFCAKAHGRREIRNLVKIYGENWKENYDLSKRETLQRKSSAAKVAVKKRDRNGKGRQRKKRVGLALPPNYTPRSRMDDGLNEESDYQCEGSVTVLNENEYSDLLANLNLQLKPEVCDYTELYEENLTNEKTNTEEVILNDMKLSLHDMSSWNSWQSTPLSVRSVGTPLSVRDLSPCSVSTASSSPVKAFTKFSFFSKEMDTIDDNDESSSLVSEAEGIFCDGQAWGSYFEANDSDVVLGSHTV